MASAERFTLKVFTPAGLLLEEQVSSVKLPSADGQIGVLPRHTRYSGLVGSGVLEFVPAAGGTTRSVSVSGGVSQFADDVLTLLADSATLTGSLSASPSER